MLNFLPYDVVTEIYLYCLPKVEFDRCLTKFDCDDCDNDDLFFSANNSHGCDICNNMEGLILSQSYLIDRCYSCAILCDIHLGKYDKYCDRIHEWAAEIGNFEYYKRVYKFTSYRILNMMKCIENI